MASGAVAAVVAKRRRERPEKTKWTQADQKRYDAMKMEIAKREKLTKIFMQYDTNKTNQLERDQVEKLLTDLDISTPAGTPPSEDELNFIIKVADRSDNGAVGRKEFD